jgi:hypothetical protein
MLHAMSDKRPTASSPPAVAKPWQWKPGESGNPKGRAPALVDIAALAREHGPRCIEVAAALLDSDDERIRMAALTALLDRGFGRPVQAIAATDNATSLTFLHMVAMRAFSDELAAERETAENGKTINAEPTKAPTAPRNLMESALE